MFLSIVIPVHNEAHRVAKGVQTLRGFLEGKGWEAELLVVDNGSSDGTLEAARGCAGVRAIREERRGKGLAVKRGMLEATGDYRFMCDVDLSMPIEELEKFLPPKMTAADVVIGSREAAGADVTDPWRRRFIGRTFNAMVRLLVLPGLRDTQCGFKCFTKAAAEVIFPRQRVTGLGFDVEVLYIARRHGLRIVEVPVTWRHDPDSRVRMGVDPLRMAADLLTIRRNGRRGVYD